MSYHKPISPYPAFEKWIYFWDRVEKGRGCWHWMLHLDKFGYGRVPDTSGLPLMAHRASWILIHGPIPEGMQVCHHCDNPPCVRPDHLFLGTPLDNIRDMIRKHGPSRTASQIHQTHCPHGHEYTETNTIITKPPGHHGYQRRCLACRKALARRYYVSKHADIKTEGDSL